MFFLRAQAPAQQPFGATLAQYGLDQAAQTAALGHPHNAHLRNGNQPAAPNHRPMRATHVVVPIALQLNVTRFQPVIDLQDGLRPRRVGDNRPPTCTHGIHVSVARNLGAGTRLNWIQTVQKLNNPDPNAPKVFVDVGHNGKPFMHQPPSGMAPPVQMDDTPCGPVAPGPNQGVDFTATTTLAVLLDDKIILAAAKVWGYTIGTSLTLPQGVTPRRHRDASTADFREQLRILRLGRNQLGHNTGPNLNYLLPPTNNSIVS